MSESRSSSLMALPQGRRSNQHLPTVPDVHLLPRIKEYWGQQMSDVEMAEVIKKDVKAVHNGWALTAKTVQRRRAQMGLKSVRQQAHTFHTIAPHVERLRLEYPSAGTKRMRDWLRKEGLLVSRHLVHEYLATYHPEDIRRRKGKRLKRKQFWAAGVFDLVAVDQHDKWSRFGLFLHLAVEPFSGALLWVKIWWTNSNPRLIFSYYLEMARFHKGIPMTTQSDPGSENNGIANGHSLLRQRLDPSLVGKLQHRWMRGHTNIKPEIKWSQLRREFTRGFEDLFDEGILNGWYDRHDLLECYLFRWMAIPWMQKKLNDYVQMHNTSRPRADRNKILPHGIPEHVLYHPERYEKGLNFKVGVTEEDLCFVEQLYAPPDHPVFELVPPTFDTVVSQFYQDLGSPTLERSTFWPIYLKLRAAFLQEPGQDRMVATLAMQMEREMTVIGEHIDLIPGEPARQGRGLGLGSGEAELIPEMTEDEDDRNEEEGDESTSDDGSQVMEGVEALMQVQVTETN